MNTIKDIITNESIEDVLTALTPNSSQPRIDRLYTLYRFEALETGELWSTYERLFRSKSLSYTIKHIIKIMHKCIKFILISGLL